MNIAYPLNYDERGRTGEADENDHIREMIEQVLFTSPGERVNRPNFGSGLMQLVFAPNSPELAAATQFAVQGALQAMARRPDCGRSGECRKRRIHPASAGAVRCPSHAAARDGAIFEDDMNYFCCEQNRRKAVKDSPGLNGIDYLEVLDDPNPPLIQVHFLKALDADTLKKENVRIEGGERITNISVNDAQRDTADQRILTSPLINEAIFQSICCGSFMQVACPQILIRCSPQWSFPSTSM